MALHASKYVTITLPIDPEKSFLELNSSEIQQYFNWFQSIRKSRLHDLCRYLFENPNECLVYKNLRVIEEFLRNNISVIPKSEKQYTAEGIKIPNKLKRYAKPKDYVFDENTISICYDIGIFMGELIIALDNKIVWALEEDERFADYGQPVLRKKSCKLEINPFMVAKNMAAKMYEGRYTDGQMISFFQAWLKGFNVEKMDDKI